MGVGEILAKLEKTKEFLDWRRHDRLSYLAHIFIMLDENSERSLQIGYYNKDSDNMVVFIERKKGFEKSQEMGIFKKPEAVIDELDPKKVRIDFSEADAISKELKEKEYHNELLQREIQILQMLEGRPVYNMTYITASFKILNIKVNAEDRTVESHMLKPIMDLGKIDEG